MRVFCKIGLVCLAGLSSVTPGFAQSVIELPVNAGNCAIHNALSPETAGNCAGGRTGNSRGIVLRIDEALKDSTGLVAAAVPAQSWQQPIAPTVRVASAALLAPQTMVTSTTTSQSHAAAKSENGYFIQFAFDSSLLEPAFLAHLDRLSDVLKIAPMASTCLKVIGHTDVVGTSAYNLKLSDRRAKSVALYLTGKRGIPAARISLEAAGEKRPLPDISGDHALNRRVEFATKESLEGC